MTILSEHKVGEKAACDSLRVSVSGKPLEHIDVTGGGRVKVLDGKDAVLVIPADHPAAGPVLAEYGVYKSGSSVHIQLFTPALEPLGVTPGDVVQTRSRPIGFALTARSASETWGGA